MTAVRAAGAGVLADARHELWNEHEHRRLLLILVELRCMVMISGYASPLYAESLEARRDWRWLDVLRKRRKAEVSL